MENQTQEINMGKGILFALGAAVVIGFLWAALIMFIDGGTGGLIGGVIAAALGALTAAAYRFGKGKTDVTGMVIVGLISALASIGAIIVGLGWLFSDAGLVGGIFDGIRLTFDLLGLDATFSSAFWFDIAVVGAVSAVAGASAVKGASAIKKNQPPAPPPQE